MRTFKQFVVEQRLTTHAEIVTTLAALKKESEILNPVYQNFVSQAKWVFEKQCGIGRELILTCLHTERANEGEVSEPVNDVYYAWPWGSFASLGKFEKLLAKLPMNGYTREALEFGRQLVKDWKPVADDIKALKSKVVKTTTKRAEVKAAAVKAMDKKKVGSAVLIKIFESHMAEYIEVAKKRAKEFIDAKLAVLKDAGWDLNKVAPPPSSFGSSNAYMLAKEKRSLYRAITKSKSTSGHRIGQPEIVEANQAMIAHYITTNGKMAEDSYRAFMEKMIHKIGKDVVKASMTGNIWTNAEVTVICDDGEEQVWNTKMILNFSKYQKMFNQFPSRRKK